MKKLLFLAFLAVFLFSAMVFGQPASVEAGRPFQPLGAAKEIFEQNPPLNVLLFGLAGTLFVVLVSILLDEKIVGHHKKVFFALIVFFIAFPTIYLLVFIIFEKFLAPAIIPA